MSQICLFCPAGSCSYGAEPERLLGKSVNTENVLSSGGIAGEMHKVPHLHERWAGIWIKIFIKITVTL